ncbi:MAG: hypothetical protein LKJ86_04125 [Oscillibacter sp.]|jgi:protein-S-isoprenylcysteine O-methyltransferase Ste14|nr:hypothetical protein [Oscillibacter sp.]
MGLLLGSLAFGLFFLNDWNDWKWHFPPLRCCFAAGTAALIAGTVLLTPRPVEWTALHGIALALAAVFALALVYTLFFALSAKDAYVRQEERRDVCTIGVYALCRHPGVLWFAGLYLCLWGSVGVPLTAGALFTALDVLLVWFEDQKVFPARLAGYETYRRTTPFLIPSASSIRQAFLRN